jgi:hypothetical protein
MMSNGRLPADSRRYSERAYVEKEAWHRRRSRMSFERKLEALDRLLEMSKHLPKLDPSGKQSTEGNR